MTNPPSPEFPDQQLAWLVDRAALSDLLTDFARCLDEADYEAHAANFTEDGILELPFHTERGRQGIAQYARGNLGAFAKVHHLAGNYAITLDVDTATSRSYVQAVHVVDGTDDSKHATLGGWYDCEYRRTPEGWRFSRVHLSRVWTTGTATEIGLDH